MEGSKLKKAGGRKAGGLAALYLALAYLAAMPYFLLVVDYGGAKTAEDKVALIVANHASMYAMYLATYVVFGIVLAVLALSLHERARFPAGLAARATTALGLLWSFALVASGLVFTYGITEVTALAVADAAQAVLVWRAMEPVAMALGGAGGEILGGLWVLLASWTSLRGGTLRRPLCWLGLAIGAAGLASVLPALRDLAYVFGLLQIVWFIWLGASLLREKVTGEGTAS